MSTCPSPHWSLTGTLDIPRSQLWFDAMLPSVLFISSSFQVQSFCSTVRVCTPSSLPRLLIKGKSLLLWCEGTGRARNSEEHENTYVCQPLPASTFTSAERHTWSLELFAAHFTGPRHRHWSGCRVCRESTKKTLQSSMVYFQPVREREKSKTDKGKGIRLLDAHGGFQSSPEGTGWCAESGINRRGQYACVFDVLMFDAGDDSIYKPCVLRWDNKRAFLPGTSSVSFPSFHVFTIKDVCTNAEARVKLCSSAGAATEAGCLRSREVFVTKDSRHRTPARDPPKEPASLLFLSNDRWKGMCPCVTVPVTRDPVPRLCHGLCHGPLSRDVI